MPRARRSRRSSSGPIGAGYSRLVEAHLVSNLGDGIGLVAYPWLASSLTRNGVLVERRDRRNLMITGDVARAVLTLIVAGVVLTEQGGLPTPDELAALGAGAALPTRPVLFAMLLVATFLLGVGEVLHDTAALTLLPGPATTSTTQPTRRLPRSGVASHLRRGRPG